MAVPLPQLDNRSILTPTSGFLSGGYTHTINPYSGCSFAGGLCGSYCYVQHNVFITRGRSWGFYGAKRNLREAYRRQYDSLRRRHQPLRIYLASSTDPYLPQEATLGSTRALLEEMLERPPELLVIQTRSSLIARDEALISALSWRCRLRVSVTVECDGEVPGLPRHATPIARRLEVLEGFTAAGIPTQVTVSPMLPIADLEGFAARLDRACNRVIVDHYLLGGDGSSGGFRTQRSGFVDALVEAGYEEWTRLDTFWEVHRFLVARLGVERVLVGKEGFNMP